MNNVLHIAKLLPVAGKRGHKLLRIAGNATGYFSAASAWLHFYRNRNAVSFFRASMNTGLAVGRINPLINISVSTLDAIGLTEKAFTGIESAIRSKADRV